MLKGKIFDATESGIMKIGGVTVQKLAKEYGTPLYVFDKNKIDGISSAFNESLSKNYGKGKIFYASKAFSCKDIYRTVKKNGLGVDVVSIGELYTALSTDTDPADVCFHGNNKSYDDLEYAIKAGVGYIVADALTEIDDIEDICFKLKKKQKVLLRVNLGIEAHTHHYIQTATVDSKFGFSIDNYDANRAIERLISKENIDFCGLHSHIGSQIFEKNSFTIAVDKITDFIAKIKDKYGKTFSVLNLGGGFGIRYTDSDPAFTNENYAEYIKAISDRLNKRIAELNLDKPFLILEPGRSIVGEAGYTLYTVGRIKKISGVKNYISVNGGMFENPRFALYQAKYDVIACERVNDKPTVKYTIAGKCCESGDIIAENVMLPEMKEGELLAVLSTGAYNYSMASNYNRNAVPAVVMTENGESYLAVKRQSLDDIIRNDL